MRDTRHIMARAIGADNTNALVGEDELAFINDMKKVPSQKNISSRNSSSDLNISHGMRRNSSFAEYFEGDLSQNLLSRRHFLRRDSVEKSDPVTAIVNHIRKEDSKDLGLVIKRDGGGGGRKKKLSEVRKIIHF